MMRRCRAWLIDVIVVFVISIVLLECLLQLASFVISRPYMQSVMQTSKSIRILCLGDSHTYGLFLDREQAWPAVLENKLKASGWAEVEVINLAYPGTNSWRIRYAIEDMMKSIRPDYVVLMVGANDFWTSSLDIKSENKTNLIHGVRQHLRLYRLYVFLMKTYQQKTVFFLEDTLRMVHEEPDDIALAHLREVLIYFGITINGDEAESADKQFAVWKEKKISLQDLLINLRSQSNNKIVWDNQHEITDMGFINSERLSEALENHLGVERRQLQGRGGVVLYGNESYQLGATLAGNESEHVDGKKASLSLADNLAFITNVIKKHNAEPILMTYHFQVKYVYANDVIRKVSDGLNIKRIELHKAILAVCKPFLCPQLLFSDLHPNVAGQIFIADQVKVFMEAVLQSKSQLEPSVSGSIE